MEAKTDKVSLKEVQDFWEFHPCAKDEELFARNRRFPDELKFMAKDFPVNGVAVDIGCGTGFEPINYTLWGSKMSVGIDLTLSSLKIAKSRGRFNVEWIQADMEHLPLKNKSVQFLSAIGTIHHTVNTAFAVAEFKRVSNGKIVVMVYNYWWTFIWTLRHLRKPEFDFGAPIVKFYTKGEVKRLFKDLRVLEIKGLTKQRMPFPLSLFAKWAWYVRATN